MGLDVYYQQDIRNALMAAERAFDAGVQANGDPDDPYSAGYKAGFRAALTTLSFAFGLVVVKREFLDERAMGRICEVVLRHGGL